MILERVKKTIQAYDLVRRKDHILVAYSGGIDSTALLHLLLELRERWTLKISLAHFNHRLRSSAEEDEQFVREVAQEHSLPLIVGTEDVRAIAKKQKLSLEEAGRILRYDFLKKTAAEGAMTKIATGHTMDDQAETFLMRLLRGSGRRGLAGISPAVERMIIRPLIEVNRQDVAAYLQRKSAPYRVDESNFDRRFFRNRIRMELIPFIQQNFEPRIIPILGKMASILRQEETLLQELTNEKSQRSICEKNDQLSLEINSLSSLPLALKRRVVRDFIRQLKGDLRDVSFEDVEAVLGLDNGKEIHLKKDLILAREGDLVGPKGEIEPQVSFEYRWSGKSHLKISEIRLKFAGRMGKKRHLENLDFDDERQAHLDLARLRFPLLVRSRREGDRYQPLGAPGKKKLKEIMRAKGIPVPARDKRPVFLSGDEIVWVLGLPVSERHKVSLMTEHIFTIQRS